MSLTMSCHLGLVEEKDGAAPVSPFWGEGNLGCMEDPKPEHPWEAHVRQQRYIWGREKEHH